nr:hypothetical protein [Bacteroidales bacterium]
MKTIITLFLAMFISMGYAQLSLDFETSHSFIGFDGGTYTQIANPVSGGINTTATVGKLVRSGGAEWAGCKVTVAPIDFSVGNAITMNVYTTAPVGTKFVIKLENGGNNVEHIQYTTVSGAWEKMSWDMSSEPLAAAKDLVLMPDLGTVGNGTATSTFYFDNITQEAGVEVLPDPDPSGTAI